MDHYLVTDLSLALPGEAVGAQYLDAADFPAIVADHYLSYTLAGGLPSTRVEFFSADTTGGYGVSGYSFAQPAGGVNGAGLRQVGFLVRFVVPAFTPVAESPLGLKVFSKATSSELVPETGGGGVGYAETSILDDGSCQVTLYLMYYCRPADPITYLVTVGLFAPAPAEGAFWTSLVGTREIP